MELRANGSDYLITSGSEEDSRISGRGAVSIWTRSEFRVQGFGSQVWGLGSGLGLLDLHDLLVLIRQCRTHCTYGFGFR